MESRTGLYNRMLATRDELKADFVDAASSEIQNRVIRMEEFRVARRVGLYFPFKNEVRTEKLFVEGDKLRKEFYYPALTAQGKFEYYRVTELEELSPSEDGTLLPPIRQSRLRDLSDLKALIVPGIAFDLSGRRMGFGKGFYDCGLRCFKGHRIALAYEFQIIDRLPMSSDGKILDWIVTEKRLIRCV